MKNSIFVVSHKICHVVVGNARQIAKCLAVAVDNSLKERCLPTVVSLTHQTLPLIMLSNDYLTYFGEPPRRRNMQRGVTALVLHFQRIGFCMMADKDTRCV